jgi:ABC-2 type transport system ATP-binding protein
VNEEAGIELRSVTVRYGRNLALDGVDLEAPRGAVYALLGRNGAGKSTLARAIAGLVLPTTGELRIAGTSARSPAIHRVRRTLGFLPQDPQLYADLTGTEFLRFIRDLYRVGDGAEARHRDRVGRIGVTPWIDTRIRTYSTGMRRKIALLASLIANPTFWVLDEPVTALDEDGVRVLEEEVARVRQESGVVLLTTHDVSLAERLADRVGVLERGRMVFEGPLSALCATGHEPVAICSSTTVA